MHTREHHHGGGARVRPNTLGMARAPGTSEGVRTVTSTRVDGATGKD
jgi:hypothetical protein